MHAYTEFPNHTYEQIRQMYMVTFYGSEKTPDLRFSCLTNHKFLLCIVLKCSPIKMKNNNLETEDKVLASLYNVV